MIFEAVTPRENDLHCEGLDNEDRRSWSTDWLIGSVEKVAAAGREISFVQTCSPEAHYQADTSDFKRLAVRHRAAFLSQPSILKGLEFWKSTGTQACISLNWPTLVPTDALGVFEHGILNAHAGDLPRYRGNACPNWAILNFETRVGLTIHRMTEELDSAPASTRRIFL